MRMQSHVIGTRLLLWVAIIARTGSCAETPQFEVVVIKPVRADGGAYHGSGGPGSDSPERLSIRNGTLRDFIQDAYPQFDDRISGSGLLDRTYSLDAILPKGTTSQQLTDMFALLLLQRFGLKFHVSKTEQQSYQLVTVRGRANLVFRPEVLTEWQRSHRVAATPAGKLTMFAKRTGEDSERIEFYKCSMQELADAISAEFWMRKVSVADRTGISGRFDLTLEDVPARGRVERGQPELTAAESDSDSVDVHRVSSALEKQLGLKLVAAKRVVESMVIDHLEPLRDAP